MELAGAAAASMKARIQRTLARAHAFRHPAPHVIVVRHHDDDKEAAEVCAVDLNGNIIKSIMKIREPISPLSIHGDLLCASHGWKRTSVVDMVTGAVADVGVDPRKKVNSATPFCVVGQVPATGEYKVFRIQADYSNRQQRQKCEVVTLGAGSDTEAGKWRPRTCPPVALWAVDSRHVVVVAGLVYFLNCFLDCIDMPEESYLKADSMAVFDLATEEWKPKTIQGPLTSSILAGERDDEEPFPVRRCKLPNDTRVVFLRRSDFQLAKFGESLVVVYCNFKENLMELWFMEDMVDATTPRWSRRYTLQHTPFGDDMYTPRFHYPLAILDDGRILAWVERTSELRAYDPETCTWTDLATLTGDCVLGVHKVCSRSLGSTALSSCTIL